MDSSTLNITVPIFWYKYFTINRDFYDSIRHNYLWFSDPSTFNDPYDFNIFFDYSCNENILREYFKKARDYYKLLGDNSFENFDIEKRISDYLKDPKKFIEDHKQLMRENN